MPMKILVKLEELAQLLFSIYLFSQLPYAWWIFPLFFFIPDLSLLGNLAGKRVGTLSYNLIHHKALAICTYIVGSFLGIPLLSLIGVVLLGHSSFDRVLGFGLLEVSSEASKPLKSISQQA
jgi:hypothetical protein